MGGESLQHRTDRRGCAPEEILEFRSGGGELPAACCVEHAEQRARLSRGYAMADYCGRLAPSRFRRQSSFGQVG